MKTTPHSLPRKESNWSISPEHATRRVIGGFSDQQETNNRKDSFDSAGLLTELNKIKSKINSSLFDLFGF